MRLRRSALRATRRARSRQTGRRRLVRAVAACAAATLSASFQAPPRALADADPASDVLLTQPAFLPYEPAVSESVESTLVTALQKAAADGLPLRVAVIAAPLDLGAVPRFFGHPQAYATFLDREISYPHPIPLVVVMRAGLGIVGVPRPNSLARVHVEGVDSSNGLAETAVAAVRELLRERGRDLTAEGRSSVHRAAAPTSRRLGGRHAQSALLFVLPAAALILLGLAAHLYRRRGARRREAA